MTSDGLPLGIWSGRGATFGGDEVDGLQNGSSLSTLCDCL
jgi:hypothetical protein